jgi:HNH endonuclease
MAARGLGSKYQGKKPGPPPSTPEHVWTKIDRRGEDECWPFVGARTTKGYGCIGIGQRVYLAHRVVYVLAIGAIPPSLFVLHRCNNPSCCNPKHLYAGTHQDNMEDAKRNGKIGGARPNTGRPKGLPRTARYADRNPDVR